MLGRADTVAHLAFLVAPRADAALTERANIEGTRRVLEAAAGAGIGGIVVVSSAMVYGAWPNNPVPLTEDAPLRPNPGVTFATQKAEIERLVAEWADDHPGLPVAVLRPVTVVGPAPCPIERIKNRWRWHLLVKSEKAGDLTRLGRYFMERFEPPVSGDLRITFDREPVALL